MVADPPVLGYLFTDIEESTRRWESVPDRMRAAIKRHDSILEASVADHGGVIVNSAGDGIFAVFQTGDPIACACAIQARLDDEDWSEIGDLYVRIGIHVGRADIEHVYDPVVANRTSRIANAAWGGQTLASQIAVDTYGHSADIETRALGVFKLQGVETPIALVDICEASRQAKAFPPPRVGRTGHFGVPEPNTPLFGRDSEITAIKEALSDSRPKLITLTGPGGIGKTRLAIEIIEGFLAERAVYFINCESVADTLGLVQRIADAVALPLTSGQDPTLQLDTYLQERDMVLVLDRAERLVGEASFVENALGRYRSVQWIMTSREPLGIAGEWVKRLSGLPPPDTSANALEHNDAFQLFAHAASSVTTHFDSQACLQNVFAEVLNLVDGNPTALIQAAQWTTLLSLEEIRDELTKNLNLLDGSRSPIANVLDTSWRMLTPDYQTDLARLSIFRGGFTVDAAREVTGAGLQTLADLERKSLIERDESGRFNMPRVMRDYALRRHQPDQDLLNRHRDYFFSQLGVLSDLQTGLDQRARLDLIDRELPNIRAALHHCIDAGIGHTLQPAIEPLFFFCTLRSRYALGENLFSQQTGDAQTDLHLLAVLANCVLHLGRTDQSRQILDEISVADQLSSQAQAHVAQATGNLAHMRGDFVSADGHYKQALAIRTQTADDMGQYYTQASLASLALKQGDVDLGKQRLRACYRLCRRIDNAHGMMVTQIQAGDIAQQEQRYRDAEKNYSRGLELEQSVGHAQMRAAVLLRLHASAAQQGTFDIALDYALQAADVADSVSERHILNQARLSIATCQLRLGRFESAREAAMEALSLADDMQAHPLRLQSFELLAQAAKAMSDDKLVHRITDIIPLDVDLKLQTDSTVNMNDLLKRTHQLALAVLKERESEDLLL